jgi:hypothetical protein
MIGPEREREREGRVGGGAISRMVEFISVYFLYFLLFSLALQPSVGYGLLVTGGFLITHNDAPHSVGLLWTSEQLVAETST